MAENIPILDLSDPDQEALVRRLRAACETAGFFTIVGHGVPDALVAAQFAAAERFFELPLDAKEAISIERSPGRRGYERLGAQRLDAAAHPDLKESFYCGLDYPADHPHTVAGHPGYGVNQWPDLPGFAAQMRAYLAVVVALGDRIMALLAKSLDLPDGAFAPAMRDPMATLRLLRYPPHPEDADARTVGAGAHTDWGAVTILAQDSSGGLEVQLPDGKWVGASPIPGGFVVNLADMIPRWTNGRYRSNPHRVLNRVSGGQPRYSIPYFHSPNYDAVIEAVPTCRIPGVPPRWPPCTAGEHLAERYATTYGRAA